MLTVSLEINSVVHERTMKMREEIPITSADVCAKRSVKPRGSKQDISSFQFRMTDDSFSGVIICANVFFFSLLLFY